MSVLAAIIVSMSTVTFLGTEISRPWPWLRKQQPRCAYARADIDALYDHLRTGIWG
jgi:hypothetical protein